MKSVIEWKIGEPPENGKYLVMIYNGVVDVDEYYGYFPTWSKYIRKDIVAWCKLTDIKTDICI